MTSGSRRELALAARSWPFEEARKLIARIEKRRSAGRVVNEVLFETGYGPSGLPHIGTFGEVARTSWVRQAFETLSDVPTRLIAFSDDMDGLRKVPDNVPNQAMLREHLGKPLTEIPDPFGTHRSFGAHNNARLKAFLDRFGFRYEFFSSTECYKSGQFDQALLTALLYRARREHGLQIGSEEIDISSTSPVRWVSTRNKVAPWVPQACDALVRAYYAVSKRADRAALRLKGRRPAASYRRACSR